MTKHQGVSRRTALQATGLGALGLFCPGRAAAQSPHAIAATALGQQPHSDGPVLEPLNRLPRMVQEYLVAQAREAEGRGLLVKESLRTKADAEAYVRSVREKIGLCFGPLPEKTPLNPRVTGVLERDAYRIEKVIFESRPGFLVAGNLYVPRGGRFPRPAVVGSCGHNDKAKAAEAYQAFSQGLARQGYVVLTIDPIGQAERMQYVDENLRPRRGGGDREHLYAGNQQFLVDEFFGTWRAWDAMCAIDYLLTRDEVDPKHVGITGTSGGGTVTAWVCALERRLTMAAPSCFITTFSRMLENELTADTERHPPRALALGLDHDDFLAAMAPKPIVILAQELDHYDVRGSIEAYRRLKRLYQLLGAEENISLHVGPGHHGFNQDHREAMYRWFNRVTGISDATTEPDLVLEEEEALRCTPQGQVAGIGSKTIYSFTREKAEALAARRRPLRGEALRSAMIEVLRLAPQTDVPEYRVLRPLRGRRYPKPHATTYLVETERGVHAVVYRLYDELHHARPPQGPKRAVLYVAHQSSDAELRDEPLVRELLESEPDTPLFTCDVRGIGDSRPDTNFGGWDTFLGMRGTDYFYAIHALMLDKPYVGQRTHDLLRVLDWLGSFDHTEVHLVATGWGALPAAFAAVLSERVTQVTLKHALTSYTDIATSESYNWPLSSFLPGALDKFDLPDCYEELRAKQLRLIDPWGPDAV
ncbi:MAG: acetylxylan esterase [Thermoguttaceae bacterium]|nr:acetylxylan esterase [Thermoguttaceae bacterium]